MSGTANQRLDTVAAYPILSSNVDFRLEVEVEMALPCSGIISGETAASWSP